MAENIQYKDAVFRSYFKNKQRVLSLYRAVSGDNSLTEEDIELNDLAEALVNGKRNDVSFISGNKLIVLIEHQSTINYNMPLRFLSYLSKFYNKLTLSKATYNKERIPLPSPQFYVFYNGKAGTEEISEMKLEDAFSDPNPVITLKVKAFDIRYERNSKLLNDCQEIMYYSIFVSKVEEYKIPEITTEQAVLKAVNYCIEHDIMKEFMEEHRQEVVNMFTEEWNIEEAKRVAAEEAAEKATEKINTLNKLLIAAKRYVDLEKAANDVDFQNKLMKELLPV
jgi:hypothetical protein